MLENTKFPAPLNDCKPFDCPIDKPPHRPFVPMGTMQEEFLTTSKRVHEALHRVLELEKRIRENLKEYTDTLTADNTAFKDICITTFNQFSDSVTNEVNTFTADITNSFNALNQSWQGILGEVEKAYITKLNSYKEELNQTYADFRQATENRIDGYNDALAESFNAYVTTVNSKIADLENDYTKTYNTFTQTITNNFNSFKEEVNTKLAQQDGEISDTVLYIKSNLGDYVYTVINEMKESGELNTQILNAIGDINTKFNTLNAQIGAWGNLLNTHKGDFNKHIATYNDITTNSFDKAVQGINPNAPAPYSSLYYTLQQEALKRKTTGAPIILTTGKTYVLEEPVTMPLVTIIGNGATFKLADSYTGDRTHIIKFTVSDDNYRERVIKDLYFDCTDVTGSAIIIEDTRNDKFENITLTNCKDCIGVDIVSGFGTYFNNVNVNNEYGYTTPAGTGIKISTSDLHFNNINVMGKAIGIEDRGINFLNNVHIWQGVNCAESGNNADSIGIYKKNDGMYSHIYFDSLGTCITFEAKYNLKIYNCFWLVKNSAGVSKFLHNETEDQPLLNVSVNGLNIMNTENTEVDFGGYDALFENITPSTYRKQATNIKYTLDEGLSIYGEWCHIRRVGEFIHFDLELENTSSLNKAFGLTLDNSPLATTRYIWGTFSSIETNGTLIPQLIGIKNITSLTLKPGERVQIVGSVPIY